MEFVKMTWTQITVKSDWLGILSSGLCLLHCLATPFLFIMYANVGAHGETVHPSWWGFLDVVFLVLSFIAVCWSIQNTSKTWVAYALGLAWLLLSFIVLNEKFELLPLAEEAIYFPTLSLIGLHIYNRRYCYCGSETCCADN